MKLKSLSEHKTAAGTSYVDCGSGEALVLIHGVGLNKQVWQPQIDAFCGEYRVVAYDTLGHGKSRIPATAQDDPNSTPEMSQRMAEEVQLGQVHIMPGERHMGQYLGAASIEPVMRRFLETPLAETCSND